MREPFLRIAFQGQPGHNRTPFSTIRSIPQTNHRPRLMSFSPPTADALRSIDNQHLWHPFTPMQAWRDEQAPIITAADQFELIDIEGNRLLDGFSSLWCNVHGHRVPEIDQAIRNQLDQMAHSTLLGLASEPSIRLAKALVDATPAGLNKVFYSDSGSTAVEIALKIAFQYQRQKPSGNDVRTQFVRVGQAYHGDTIGSVSVGGIPVFHAIFGRSTHPRVTSNGVTRKSGGCSPKIRRKSRRS